METQASSGILSYFPPPHTPRAEQAKAILAIEREFEAGNSIVAFQGPTGSGKTFSAMTLAKSYEAIGQKTFILSIQRALQDQYARDFAPPIIESLKGRTNYRCSYGPTSDRDASRGYCRSVKKKPLIQDCLKSGTVQMATSFDLAPEAHLCDYWRQLALAVNAPITLFNFHSFLFQQRLGRFGKRDFMVIDECHNIESVLLQFVEIAFSDDMLGSVGIKLDLTLKTPEDVLAWLEKYKVVERIIQTLGGAAFSEEAAEGLSPQETDQLKSALDRIELLKKFFDMTEWVVDVLEEPDPKNPKEKIRKLRVRPVFVSLFARELIFSKADRVLAMSATILDPKIWARNLGLSSARLGYVEAPCTFPVKNRPIFLDYAGNLGWKTFDQALPAVYRKIAQILDKHRGQRGIIHAHSEKLVRLIVENVRSPRFTHLGMFPTRDKTVLLAEHAKKADSVIVGSAFHEGIDLADDLGRFSIIAKTPWPSTGDALVKKRMELDGSYLPYQAALRVIQAVGRCVRGDADWAETTIIDQNFERLLLSGGKYFPKWFMDAIQKPEEMF
jgi:ATP-dependent DNA helicase DinG